MKGLSLFASGGIGELGLRKLNIEIILANELLPIRAKLHKFWHPSTEMVVGDISDENIQKNIINKSIKEKIEFILCTPPCQGVSLIGKNKNQEDYIKDRRNYLLFDALNIMKEIKPSFILIENVPRYLNLYLPYRGELINIVEIIKDYFDEEYKVEYNVYNAVNFNIAQNRERAFIMIYKKNYIWNKPTLSKKIITLEEAIGSLPSLESGESSNIKNHYSRKHSEEHVLWMKHTKTGKSALENDIFFPRNKKTGKKIKAYSSSYKRMNWDKPSPTITMRNDAISSQSNVHPGRKKVDGTYSDARVLSLRELFILFGINPDISIPSTISDIQIRHMIGEAVPPVMIEKIVEGIEYNKCMQ